MNYANCKAFGVPFVFSGYNVGNNEEPICFRQNTIQFAIATAINFIIVHCPSKLKLRSKFAIGAQGQFI